MRTFRIGRVASALLLVGVVWGLAACGNACAAESASVTTDQFAREVERGLPVEELYDYHKRLAEGPVHVSRRQNETRPRTGEMVLPERGWRIVWNRHSPALVERAAADFRNYLEKSMGVRTEVEARDSLVDWQGLRQCIVVGTRDQMPGCGAAIEGPKDYEIAVTPERVAVCGYDARGAMFGLYNLEARMNLRESPCLPGNLQTVRHSLYDVRLVHSWLGWMEWPDALLAQLAHDGFDGIYASAMANPNGDRTTADTSTDFYARILFRIRNQDPARMHDLIERAGRHGIKVYAPIIYQYLGTPQSEVGLRRLVREIVKQFPDIQGYVLLTEGFWYKTWGGGHGASQEYMRDWAQNWSRAVGIVAEECHRVNPAIEILPWEYNIDFRPQNVEMKRYFIQQLPADTVPLLTWENGKGFQLDGLSGHLCDYAISQVGPAEVTQAQIAEAHRRGMKIYANADTFVCGGQLQTVPYHPFAYQWYERYKALEQHGVRGALESWTSGYTPNWMTELRGWYCWSDAPPFPQLLEAIASRQFGSAERPRVLAAWKKFSEAIRLVPDTGPTWGTSAATGNPIFLRQPPARTATFTHSWTDQEKWMGYLGAELNPSWPFTVSRLVFCPDFTNRTNRAEAYARGAAGIEFPASAAQTAGQRRVLPVFLKHLRLAAERFGEGLELYQAAALESPAAKRAAALKEVMLVEQIQRMLLSEAAILEFEDLRLELAAGQDPAKADRIRERMEILLHEEIARTELALVAARHDSRLGFQSECDYVYTPYSLGEKLKVLAETREQLKKGR